MKERPRSLGLVVWLLATSICTIGTSGCASAGGGRAGSPPGLSRAAVREIIDSIVGGAQFRSAQIGVLIVHPASGDTLYSRNAGKLFMPASNQKILTTAVALTQLGPSYRYRTTFATRGALREGVLTGDLIVIGRGDPSVSAHMRTDGLAPLREIADSLRARGISRIAGHLVEGGDAFPGPNISPGWDWDDLDEAYGAGVDELMLNEGFTLVVARGASVGQPVTVTTSPSATYPSIRNDAVTVDSSKLAEVRAAAGIDSARQRSTVHVGRDTLTGGILVTGFLAPGDSAVATLSLRDPAHAYLVALGEALHERDIEVDSGVSHSMADSTLTGALDTLLVIESPPLTDILPALMKPSQNQLAEVLLRTLGLERTGTGSADSGRRVIERQLLAWGAASDGFVVHDGSGLSRQNLVSPETIIRVLDAMHRDTLSAAYVAAFPIAGVDGTLERRMRGTPAEGNVRAKTGTLTGASSLSGYVTTHDGEMLLFSILANHFTRPGSEVTRAQDAITAALAGMDWFRR